MTADRLSLPRRLGAILAGFEDGAIIRFVFLAMLAGTLAVLFIDFRELSASKAALVPPGQLLAPGFDPLAPRLAPGPAVTTDRALLEAPLTLTLKPGGVLALVGTVDVGAAERFDAEIAARGEYIGRVTLDSPGGSVTDALAIGTAIRAGGFSTDVEAGALCASSCPLMLAGGIERQASQDAAIGVHQIYAMTTTQSVAQARQAPALAMADAQRTTATITRYLGRMGVSADLWLFALETPPDQLYFLKPNELTGLQLVTGLH